MHATQPQGAACPEPTSSEPVLFGTVTAGGVFQLVRSDGSPAYQPPTAATPPPPPAGPDLQGMTQHEFYRWATGTDPACTAACETDGYVVTETGLHALADPGTGEAPATAAQVLRDAALYLERHGWIQGAYYDATSGSFTPPACLVGAIGMACYGGPVDAPAQHFDDPGFLDFEEAVLHLDRYLMVEDGSESYEFNDAKGRRAEDVTRVLRDAASRPADELIDALRAIDVRNAQAAALVGLLKPRGLWGDPAASADPAGGDA